VCRGPSCTGISRSGCEGRDRDVDQQSSVNPPPPTEPSAGQQPQPVPQPQWEYTEPLAYHQLLRGTPRYRWWKPLLALVLGVIYFLVFSVVYGIAIMVPYLAVSGAPFDQSSLMALAIPDTQNPTSMLLALGSIALMIPSAMLAMLSVQLTPFSRLWSVALRIRWRLLGRTTLMALVALVVMDGLGILFEVVFSGFASGEGASEGSLAELDMTAAAWSALFILLLVPLQATAEELVYRGMFMQVLGAWLGGIRAGSRARNFLRGPWLPIALPAIAFGFSHIYDWWGWGMVVAMALVAGWISWRTGGLEAAVSLHIVNNLVAFGFMVFGLGGQTAQTEDGGGPGSLLGAILGLAFYAWWVDVDFRRRDGIRTRIDTVESRRRRA